MKREELKAEALINLGSEPAPKEWEKLLCIKEQMPSCIGGEVSLQRFVGTDICAWFVGIGGLWEPQSDYFRVSLPPAEGAEQRMRVRNILQDFYRRGEYELEQAEEDIMRLFQPQPTAEGAEEYIKVKHPQDWDEIPQWHIDEIKEFATLHAQRIADKMVSENKNRNQELSDRLSNGRHFLMGINPSDLTVEDALDAFGFGKNGLKV